MELTKAHLKKLQAQIKNSCQTKRVPSFSDSRIDILFLHEDQIPKAEDSNTLDDEDSETDNTKVNSSMVNFQVENGTGDGEKAGCVNYESTLNINQTMLNNVSIHVKNGANETFKIFDPENSSLLYVKKNKDKEVSHTTSLVSLKNTPSTNMKNRSKISKPGNKPQKIAKSQPQLPIMRAPSIISTRSKSKKRSSAAVQSQVDLRFPKLDQLILKLAEQRSL